MNILKILTFIFLIPNFIYAQNQLDVVGDSKMVGKLEIIKSVGDSAILIGANAGINLGSGGLNTVIGANAGMNMTGGVWNTYLGYNAGLNGTGGNGNTFIGRGAGQENSSYSNLFLGNLAGRDNTGFENTMVGTQSGLFSSGSGHVFLGALAGLVETGNNKLYIDNSGIGTPLIWGDFDANIIKIHGTLNVNNAFSFPITDGTSGQVMSTNGSGILTWGLPTIDRLCDLDNNTKIQLEEMPNEDIIRFDLAGTEKWVMTGNRLESANTGFSIFIGAGSGNVDDISNNLNVAVGDSTMYMNTSGQYNTAIGYKSLYTNTIGEFNTGLGLRALFSNTEGKSNTAVGGQALTDNTTGEFNTAVGRQALASNITAHRNTAVGNAALGFNETGEFNTAVGHLALYQNQTGSHNTVVGLQAMIMSSEGDFNVALGSDALHHNASGDSNTATGTQSLYLNTTGDNNTANGYLSLLNNQLGNANTAMGASALYSNINGGGNVAIGYQSLLSMTNDTLNTAIGTEAGSSATGDRNVFLGYRAGLSSVGDDLLYIENSSSSAPLIYGDFANDSLKIHGTFNINDAYSFPTTDGSVGQVLQSDGMGNMSWISQTVGGCNAYGDGTAGDVTISANTDWSTTPPTNGNYMFNNLTINSGFILTVYSGTEIRVAGTFTNNGTIVVNHGVPRQRWAGNSDGGFPATAGMAYSQRFAYGAEAFRSILEFGPKGGSNGTDGGFTGADLYGGAGGGTLVIKASTALVNSATGTIQAVGEAGNLDAGSEPQMRPGPGGGGGGFILLISNGSITNSGSIIATGGNGADAGSTSDGLGGGGGGGGLIHLMSPNANSVAGTLTISGGTAGLDNGLANGNSGGNGGAGAVNGGLGGESAGTAEDGATGAIMTTQLADPCSRIN